MSYELIILNNTAVLLAALANLLRKHQAVSVKKNICFGFILNVRNKRFDDLQRPTHTGVLSKCFKCSQPEVQFCMTNMQS